MSFINALGGAWGPVLWTFLLAIPPAILLLYFLKLKRQPVEVPSTYLWTRTIEDLHVNSIWQRLRQSLLLFLQLLVLLLAILALLRPGWRGSRSIADRSIFILDTSASMSATDVSPSRLGSAKEQALKLIDQMESDDVAMVISFSDVANIEQPFTNNRNQLRQSVNKIKPTNRRTDINEALRAASGLANPGRTSDRESNLDVQVAEALPATMYIFSDGAIPRVTDFAPGNLTPKYFKVGSAEAQNVGVVAFSTERNPEKPGQLQAYARLENSGAEDVDVQVELYLDGSLVDASNELVPSDGAKGVNFILNDVENAVLELRVRERDHLPHDNIAYVAINTPRRARVLLVTPGNDALKFAITTESAAKVADVAFATPDILANEDHQQLARGAAYDLIIYDRCLPEEMPEANTLFIGTVPTEPGWSAEPAKPSPGLVDIDRLHPMMHLVELRSILIYESLPIEGPDGATSLIDADHGSLLLIAPRPGKGYEDAVLSFEIVGAYPDGDVAGKTNWVRRKSFPVFVMNVLRYLGGGRSRLDVATSRPGRPVKLQTEVPVEQITVESPPPARLRTTVLREGQNQFVYSQTDQLGVYTVREGNEREAGQFFAINLFDSLESDLVPRDILAIPYFDEEAENDQQPATAGDGVEEEAEIGVRASRQEPARQELWKWLLLAGLVALIFEWWVYNRRIYL